MKQPEETIFNATLAALSARKSVRVFAPRAVAPHIKAAVLNAALQAPTAGNQMMYTILDITQPARKASLAVLCDNQPFIAAAPVVLIFLADCQRWWHAFDAAGCAPRMPREGDLLLAVADACIAAQNAVVAAESLGLGSCYIGDVLEHCAQMRALLALPPYVMPAAMLVMGYPAPAQLARKKPARFHSKYIVHENTYHALTPAESRAMYEERAGKTCDDYNAQMLAFCNRKYNAAFSREMSRSVAEYLQAFGVQDEGTK